MVIEIPMNEFGGNAPGIETNDEVKRLRSTHELWDKFSPRWEFFLSAYEGGEDFANGRNLFKHVRETDEDFNDRCKRVHNLNYCEPLVDFYTNFIFSESIDRSGAANEEFYREFIKDVNKKGDSVDDFMRDVSDDKQIFGMAYGLVDMPPLPAADVVTKADEKRLGLRPYWVLVKPEEIIDWTVDAFGNFTYVKRKQIERRVVGGSVRTIEKYTEYFSDIVAVSEVDVTKSGKAEYLGKEEFPNRLGEIPLVVVRYKRSKKDTHIGLSFLRDFALNNREIMNLTSLLQEFLYRQAFNILVKESEIEGIPLKEEGDVTVGTANLMEIPKGAQMPEYISPPADPARFIQDERQRIAVEMFKRAAHDLGGELSNGETSSGFSQAQSFSKTVPYISARAEALERFESEMMRLTMKFMGKDWDGKIKYKDRYEITNLSDALTQLQILVRDFLIPSETFVKQELKRMINEYDGKLPPDMLAKVHKEIDEMDFEKWLEDQKTALIGRQGTSPGDQQKPKDTGTIKEKAAEAKANVASTKKVRGKK